MRFRILSFLSIADRSYATQLTKELRVHRAAIQNHLATLEKAGMVKKDKKVLPEDKKKGPTYYKLTDRGQQVLNRVRIPLSVPRLQRKNP